MQSLNFLKKFILILILNAIVSVNPANAITTFTISGTINDSLTGETLPYASVVIKEMGVGLVANQYGFYSIVCPEGAHQIEFSYIGYKPLVNKINIDRDTRLNIQLKPVTRLMDEAVIKSFNIKDESNRRLSNIDIKKIKELPNLGEPDLLKSIQILPGVTSVAEVGRGFNVRGGAMDQNLIMLDEALIYNASHMLGFYSVFNSDIIKDVKFYKNNIPSNYGGRLSSVMDVIQKDGNMKNYRTTGGTGLIASRLTFEGPIIKDKASFIVSGRRSYIDLFFKLIPENSELDIKGTSIYFYDLNAKLNYKINDNNRLFLSSYYGFDVLKVDDYNQSYGNYTATLRYNHIYNHKLFSNLSVIYSDYKMVDGESSDLTEWENLVSIKHYQIKNEFTYFSNKNTIKFGFDAIYRNFYPGELKSKKNELFIKIPNQHNLESAIYLNDLITLIPKIELQFGLRFSMYHYLGKEEIYIYKNGVPRTIHTIIDTVNYDENKIIQFNKFFEPRLSISYKLNESNTLSFSFNKTTQYNHLISNTITPTPYNMWKPSNNNIKPLEGNQLALGYFASLLKNGIDFSFEAFYRKMHNILEVKPGADIVLNRTLDADLLEGIGKAYGFEFLASKSTGKNTGSISYTHTRSLRKIDDIYINDKLFQKGYYSSDYDIPNKITVLYSYKIGVRSSLTSSFTYMSGRPTTFPDGQYIYYGTLIPYYSGRNQHRLPPFHRLDLALRIQSKQKEIKKWTGYWVFSLYNVYARKNPYSIYLKRISGSKDMEAIQFSVLGTIVPSIAYSFDF